MHGAAHHPAIHTQPHRHFGLPLSPRKPTLRKSGPVPSSRKPIPLLPRPPRLVERKDASLLPAVNAATSTSRDLAPAHSGASGMPETLTQAHVREEAAARRCIEEDEVMGCFWPTAYAQASDTQEQVHVVVTATLLAVEEEVVCVCVCVCVRVCV